MRTQDPYDRPLRILAIGEELVFLGDGPVNFAMTREAAALTRQTLARARAATPEPAGTSDPEPGGRGVILVVEDEPLVRRLAAAVLEEAGYAVIQADGSR